MNINKLKNNKTIYFYYRILRYWRSTDFRDLVRGFMGPDEVLVRHPGEKGPDEYVYSMNADNSGFFVEINKVLGGLYYAEAFHLKPVVDWSSNCLYLGNDPVNGTRNVFEYYFEPLSEFSYKDINQYHNVIYSTCNQSLMIMPNRNNDVWTYRNSLTILGKLGMMYKKYIKLNQITQSYIDENLRECLKGRRTLGVHIRGTDFKKAFNNHPVVISPNDYIVPVKELMEKHGYEQIFLATDSLEAVKLFRKEFGSMLVYYEDVMRSDGDVGVHCMDNERKNHHYLLGLEVLRDAYTLAACDSLLAGMSNVSLAAQYIKIAGGAAHEEVKILDHGINHNNRRIEKYKGKG